MIRGAQVLHIAALAAISVSLGCAELAAESEPSEFDEDRAPAISDVEIIDNPLNRLSAFVRWSTDIPSTSVVELGNGDELTFWVGDRGVLATRHEVVVIGMRPETPYRLDVVSESSFGHVARSETLGFVAGALPFRDFEPTLTTYDEALSQPGWTLGGLVSGGIIAPVLAVMFDGEGFPVWYAEIDGDARADVDATLVDGDRVLIGGGVPGQPVEVDLAGEVVWGGPQLADQAYAADGSHHHLFRKLDNGHYLTMEWSYSAGLHDAIVEADADWNTVWRWDSTVHTGSDYAWGNAALIDLEEDAAYYGVAEESLLYKISRSDDGIEWALGNGGDFEFVTQRDDSDPWFLRGHSPELLPDGHLLLHDNGDSEREHSRVVEYRIDEQTMEAHLVWEYPGLLAEDHWYNRQWGDADRLANGNTLVTAGSTVGSSSPSRLFEVTPDGTKVWELLIGEDDNDEDAFGVYTADRIPELVHRL